MRTQKILLVLILIVVVGGGIWLWWGHHAALAPTTNAPTATMTFACAQGKSIVASFYDGPAAAAPAPGQPPTPTGHVELSLSDGRHLSLPQTLSADGARYSDGNPQVTAGQPGSESFVFWEKGNGAFVEEGASQQQTYTDCVTTATDPGGLPSVYTDPAGAYSFRYPSSFTLDASYTYQELGPGKDIHGVKVTIPASMAAGTNLSSDSYLSVEQMPNVQDCEAKDFLDSNGQATSTTVTDAGTTYSVISNTGAGAGNRYEETVYALSGSNPCIAVRYYIHYGVLENYPAGAVKAFDHDALVAQFDAIRRTLTIAQ